MIPFSARYIGRDTWIIQGEGCDCYLLLANEEAVMIDTGCARKDIRAFAQSLTTRPVKSAINTHSHFDHTGGNGWFEKAYVTAGISRSAKNTMDAPRADYPLDYAFTLVRDGDILPIAGRPLEVVELDCHSPGDMVLLDRSRRMLFTGDEVEAGQVLLLPGYAEKTGEIHSRPAAAVETYLGAVQKMQRHRDAFDWLCPAHNGSPLSPVYLDWFEALCGEILDGKQGDENLASPSFGPNDLHFPFAEAEYLRASHEGASLVYQRQLLREVDRAHAEGLFPATQLHLISAYSI